MDFEGADLEVWTLPGRLERHRVGGSSYDLENSWPQGGPRLMPKPGAPAPSERPASPRTVPTHPAGSPCALAELDQSADRVGRPR